MRASNIYGRFKSITVHLSKREWVLLVGYAHLVGKSVTATVTDLAMAAVLDFDNAHPGVLIEEARKVLDKKG